MISKTYLVIQTLSVRGNSVTMLILFFTMSSCSTNFFTKVTAPLFSHSAFGLKLSVFLKKVKLDDAPFNKRCFHY